MLDFGFYNMDCIKGMKQFPDNYFDLAIVDPPYFEGPNKREFYGHNISPIGVKKIYKEIKYWEIPNALYFEELFRVSKNQIVWGCNYYDYKFGTGRIIWDKVNGQSDYSDCEIAFCSMHNSVRLFRYMWNGMMQGKSIDEGYIQQGNKKLNEKRIHPTQKPIALYEWILSKYSKNNDVILDTHVGSASSLIACHRTNHKFVGFELDPYYYAKAKERLDAEMAQMSIYDFINVRKENEV